MCTKYCNKTFINQDYLGSSSSKHGLLHLHIAELRKHFPWKVSLSLHNFDLFFAAWVWAFRNSWHGTIPSLISKTLDKPVSWQLFSNRSLICEMKIWKFMQTNIMNWYCFWISSSRTPDIFVGHNLVQFRSQTWFWKKACFN